MNCSRSCRANWYHALVAARLAIFILRAKVKLADESPAWPGVGRARASRRAAGAESPGRGRCLTRPERCGACAADAFVLRLGGSASPARALVLQPRESAAVLAGIEAHTPAGLAHWQLGAIGAGEPQVYAATSEEFVAQMLNLDVLEGISFEKGCYIGQEVIARAHFRGRVKRRLQRFLTATPAQLAPGEVRELPDGRSVKVVDAIQRADGRCEFLGVAGFAADEADVAATAAPATGAASLQARHRAAADALRTAAPVAYTRPPFATAGPPFLDGHPPGFTPSRASCAGRE